MKIQMIGAVVSLIMGASAWADSRQPLENVDYNHIWATCEMKAADYIFLKTGQDPVGAMVMAPTEEAREMIEVFIETAECEEGGYSVWLNANCGHVTHTVAWGTCDPKALGQDPDQNIPELEQGAPKLGQKSPKQDIGQDLEQEPIIDEPALELEPELEQGAYKDEPALDQEQDIEDPALDQEQELEQEQG